MSVPAAMSWWASASVRQEIAALLDAYTDAYGTGAMPPSMLDVFTTTPGSPESIIRGTKESIPLATPNTFTEKHQTQSFASCSHGRPPPPDVTPALLKRRWHAPSMENTLCARDSTAAGDETSVTTPRTSPSSANSF